MTRDEFTEYVERLQYWQLEAMRCYGVIFQVSVSWSQVRAVVYASAAPAQSYFLYKAANVSEGEKVLDRVQKFMNAVAVKQEETGNG